MIKWLADCFDVACVFFLVLGVFVCMSDGSHLGLEDSVSFYVELLLYFLIAEFWGVLFKFAWGIKNASH